MKKGCNILEKIRSKNMNVGHNCRITSACFAPEILCENHTRKRYVRCLKWCLTYMKETCKTHDLEPGITPSIIWIENFYKHK